MPHAPRLSRPTPAQAPAGTPAHPRQPSAPAGATAALVLADGTTFWGTGLGATGIRVGEVCFNTSITGYQEILTDPSYAGQIITFTFPHIGNVGTNDEDIETLNPVVRGLVLRADITEPSNWRARAHLDAWLKAKQIVGVAGVDTRALTRRIRDLGAPNGTIAHAGPKDHLDAAALAAEAKAWPGLEGMDLAKDVSCRQSYSWDETRWRYGKGYGKLEKPRFKVVALDFGAKRNILRSLADQGCDVIVLPATATAEEVLARKPDGVFLSNGPGDPAATGEYAVPTIKRLVDSGKPVFGICLGHQMLALALGGKTKKMDNGHRGANHPVKDLTTGKVEITSQNHGFEIVEESLPKEVVVTHRSLFDGGVEGIELKGKPVFSVQYHPEASPGPEDSQYLFERFVKLMDGAQTKKEKK